MNTELSDNTKAILLLTAPLIVGSSRGSAHPLNSTEYGKLAHRLLECGRQPADLMGHGASEALHELQHGFGSERLGQLLERGFLLSQALERWQARSIWVVSRADPGYPRQFKWHLGSNAPPVLYGCGNATLLEHGGLAVVGSRDAPDDLIEYAERIGRLSAKAQHSIVSGGARGIDQAAMRGALAKGGTAVGILADGLENEAMNRDNRDKLMDGRLVLVSPYDPGAGFNVGNAMQRNKLVYALADAGLVVESGYNKGGTWAGAVEQLSKLRWVPIYIRSDGEIGKGLRALQKKGALEWPNPQTPGEFRSALSNEPVHTKMDSPRQAAFQIDGEEVINPYGTDMSKQIVPPIPSMEQSNVEETHPADALFAKVEELLELIDTPTTDSDVAKYLQVPKNLARDWLKRLTEEEKYQRLTKPVRYIRISQVRPGSN